MSDFVLTDVPFDQTGEILLSYTCDGENVAPPLVWSDPPTETESLVVVIDDPDASVPGSFTHWVLFNLPPTKRRIPRGYRPSDASPDSRRSMPGEAVNDFGDTGYGGPCPPDGESHRYIFSVYALDDPLELTTGASVMEVVSGMSGHVVAKAEQIGRYQRTTASSQEGSRGARAAV